MFIPDPDLDFLPIPGTQIQGTKRLLILYPDPQHWIPRRSILVCFLSLSAKAGLNLSPFEISSL
jgi:hypothetical protein